MAEEMTDRAKALELLSIAATAVQIYKLASAPQPLPATEVAVVAGDVAEEALKRARTLLRQPGVDEPAGE